VTSKQLWSLLLLNSAMLSTACSTYFSFCGNGLTVAAEPGGGAPAPGASLSGSYLRSGICAKWLHPVPTAQYPTFSSWMIYGEGAGAQGGGGGGNGTQGSYILIDLPLDGLGIIPVPAGGVISPVFTLWLTLLFLLVANALADHAAAEEVAAGGAGELRRMVSSPDMAQLSGGSSSNLSAMDLASALRPGEQAGGRRGGGGGAGGGLGRPRRSRSMEMQRGAAGWLHAPALASFNPRQLLLNQELAHSAVQLLLDQTSRLGSKANSFLEQHGLPPIHLAQLLDDGRAGKGPAPQPAFQPMVGARSAGGGSPPSAASALAHISQRRRPRAPAPAALELAGTCSLQAGRACKRGRRP
jgi:hypothetical protein